MSVLEADPTEQNNATSAGAGEPRPSVPHKYTSSRSLGGRSTFRVLLVDRYLFREFVVSFLGVMAFCSVLILVGSIFEKFGDIFQFEPPLKTVVLYFAASLPFRLIQVVPIAAMLAVLFAIGGLARNNEMVALMTSGISPLRIAAPVIFGGALIAGGTFLLNETAIPELERRARIYELEMERKDVWRKSAQKNLLVPGRENRDYTMRMFTATDNKMIRPLIVDRTADGSQLKWKIMGDEAVLVENRPGEKKSVWQFTNAHEWKFSPTGAVESYEHRPGPSLIALEENLPQLLARQKPPEEMNFRELREHVAVLRERGQPVSEHQTDLLVKLTFPAGILLIVVIGFAYGVRTRSGTAMAMFGYGTVWAFAYYMITAFFQAFGHSGRVPPIAAVGIPLGLFFVAALVYLRRSTRWYA